MKKILTIVLALCIADGGISAREDIPTPLPDGTNVILFGMGEYENLGESIYIGAVYLALLDVNILPGTSKRMEMRIVTDNLSARRFTQLWVDAITLSSSREERNAQADQIQQFGRLFQDSLVRGDRVSFDYLASREQTVVLLDEVPLGEIPGADFYHILLNAWIGDIPLSGQLKAGLLKQVTPEKTSHTEELFADLVFSSERHHAVMSRYSVASGQKHSALGLKSLEDDGKKEAERLAEEARLAALEGQRQKELAERARIAAAEKAARIEAERLARIAEEERLAREKAEEERARFEEEQEQLIFAYRETLVRWLSEYLEYPQRAVDRGQTGRVELSVVSNRKGEIIAESIVSSSGNSMLDRAALRMLERGKPLPEMPEALVGETFTFIMPVNFYL
ncbi:MAG: TonB family protein [Pseudomonadales bacterium]|nr:TonB family protein [Pseudomonadales bacterium]